MHVYIRMPQKISFIPELLSKKQDYFGLYFLSKTDSYAFKWKTQLSAEIFFKTDNLSIFNRLIEGLESCKYLV